MEGLSNFIFGMILVWFGYSLFGTVEEFTSNKFILFVAFLPIIAGGFSFVAGCANALKHFDDPAKKYHHPFTFKNSKNKK